MRILEVCPDYPPWAGGGAPQTFRALARAWISSGHAVTVVTTRPGSAPGLPPSADAPVVRSFELEALPRSLHEAAYFAPMTRAAARAFREFARTEADAFDLIVVHGLLETAPRAFLRECRARDLAHLFSLQYGVSSADTSPFLSPAARVAYRTWGRRLNARLRNVIVFSRESEREWADYFGARRRVRVVRLPLGIDSDELTAEYTQYRADVPRLDAWQSSRRFPPPFLLAIGRHDRAKGFDVAIEAFAQLAGESPHLSLVLAGQPTPFTEELRRDVRRAGLTERVVFPGRVSEWERLALLDASRLFLIPSRKEGYGLNAVLARVLGKSTVATRTGAHEETLSGDPRARLVPPEDPAELARAIRESLPQAGRGIHLDSDLLQAFDLRHLADKLVELAGAPSRE